MITFIEFVEVFIQNYADIKLEKSTIMGYKSCIKTHLIPYFGDIALDDIKRFSVQQFINDLYRIKKLSPKTIKNIISVLDIIMTVAVKWDFCEKNPVENVDLPPQEVKESDYYNREELQELICCLQECQEKDLKYVVALEYAFLCGYRKSEIVGLEWSNVDLNQHISKVIKKRIAVVGQGVIEGKPKTRKSIRTTVIPEPLLTHLVQLRSQYPCADYVICGDNGDPIYPPMLAKWLDRFLMSNNLRHISLHKLRHTYASLLSYVDVDIKSASEQLGHAQATTTLNIYTHLFTDRRQDIADKITKLLYK